MLLINLKKSSFMKTELIYLGFVISSNELKMDPEKVKAIKEWPSPRSMFEVSVTNPSTKLRSGYATPEKPLML
jgi:hypothetical protein